MYDPFSLETQLDPYPTYASLLEHEPVYRNSTRGFYALSRFADVQAAFRDWETYSSADGVTVDELLEITGPSFLTMDPPRHDALRDILKTSFRPKQIELLEADVRAHVGALIAELDDEVDIVGAFAQRLPIRVICGLMGLPLEKATMLQGVFALGIAVGATYMYMNSGFFARVEEELKTSFPKDCRTHD